MRTPEFTAEASLYKTSGHYHVVGAGAISTVQVVPQQMESAVLALAVGNPCRGACKCCGVFGYPGCCSRCDDCL